jgi:hypothetical protein
MISDMDFFGCEDLLLNAQELFGFGEFAEGERFAGQLAAELIESAAGDSSPLAQFTDRHGLEAEGGEEKMSPFRTGEPLIATPGCHDCPIVPRNA